MTEDNTDLQQPPLEAVPATTPETNPADVLKKRVYIGFAATMALGMAVAGAYISGRLFAKVPTHPVVAVASKMTPKPAVTEVLKPTAAPVVVDTVAVDAKTAVPEAATAPIVAKASEPPLTQNAPAEELFGDVISPKHGEKYLQIAALGSNGTARYVPELRAGGFHALVAPGPESNIYRVVVGPFADQPSLEKERDALDAAGIQSMLRVY